jgi:hypothetical protein
MKNINNINNSNYSRSVSRLCNILNSNKSSYENKLLALIGLAQVASKGIIKIYAGKIAS